MTNFLQAHHEILIFALSTLSLSVVSTMPPPGTKWTWGTAYDWAYDSIHLFISIATHKPEPPATPEEGKLA